jgi:hypothetical protein
MGAIILSVLIQCSVKSRSGKLSSVHPKTVVFGFKRSALSIQLSAKGIKNKELADRWLLKAPSVICLFVDGHYLMPYIKNDLIY